jgi:hypothetical protein
VHEHLVHVLPIAALSQRRCHHKAFLRLDAPELANARLGPLYVMDRGDLAKLPSSAQIITADKECR